MKNRTVALLMGTMMVAALVFAGCGKSTEATTEDTNTTSVETTTEDATDTADASESQSPMEYMDSYYTFTYDPDDFTVTEMEDHSCSASYTNEDVQLAGSHVVAVYVAYDTPYEEALKSAMSNLGATDYEVTECNFGADGVTAYTVTYAPEAAEGSELKTTETFYAVPDGEDTVLVDVFHTVSTDEESEMAVSDATSALLDTFSLMDAQ